jgi:hypothetical protein
VNENSRELLKIALDRGYLTAEEVRRVARESKVRRVTPERVLLERRILSVRRMERLRTHLRFKVTRRTDKTYAALAVRSGVVTKRAIRAALKYQKTLFTSERRTMRLGSRLIEQNLITVDEDRRLRSKVRGQENLPVAVRRGSQASSTQALALDEESALRSQTAAMANANYQAIEAALARVEAIHALRDDLSTSEQAPNHASPDSAAEFENALTMLARARVGVTPGYSESGTGPIPPKPRRPRKRTKKKSTGAFLLKMLGRGAA